MCVVERSGRPQQPYVEAIYELKGGYSWVSERIPQYTLESNLKAKTMELYYQLYNRENITWSAINPKLLMA